MQAITTATSGDVASRMPSVAVLPVGSFEQHGDHLPLATDTLIADVISRAVAEEYGLFALPPVTLSCSHEHAGFPGTVSISARTLTAIIDDVRESLARTGIAHLVLVNGHGGNYVLSNIAQEANVDGARVALFPGRVDFDIARARAGMVTNASEDMHAGEWETSFLLHACPTVVRPTYVDGDFDAPKRPHILITGMGGYSETGVIGRPSAATAAKGKLALQSLVETFRDTLDALTG